MSTTTSSDGNLTVERAASTGMPLTDATWLDAHLEAYRPEYESMLAWAELQPGWRVLDAGCGSGSFLQLIAGHVGPEGSIAALDLAPDNIAALEQRLIASPLVCPVEARVGSITELPYADGQFDAVWIGNVIAYLTDAELTAALAESWRVVRPGGLLAIKDADPALQRFCPADPLASINLCDAVYRQRGDERLVFSGWFRTRELRRWLERAGFVDVRQRMFPIERWAPLTDSERRYLTDMISFFTTVAEEVDLPDEERAFWRIQRDSSSPNHLLNQPDFYSGAGQVVAVGHVPSRETGE